jgi:hypothetical protein
VLAIFPQFSWYSVPPNPGSKSLGELLGDMLFQLEQSVQGNSIHSTLYEYARVRSKITEGMLQGFNIDAAASYAPSQDVPIRLRSGTSANFFTTHGAENYSLELLRYFLGP